MEKELAYLGGALENPQRPFVAILGGAKISGKIDVIEQLLPKVDRLIIGGAMACTFFKAMGLETGKSLVEADRVDMAEDAARTRGGAKLHAARRCARRAGARRAAERARRRARCDPRRPKRCSTSGRASAADSRATIAGAKTVVWNGPMGVFETTPFDAGTRAVADAMARRRRAGRTTIVGGGDSAAAVAEMGLDGCDEPRLDRRRRVARISRGKDAARCGRSRRPRVDEQARLRGELENEPRADRGPSVHGGIRRAMDGARRSHGDLLSHRTSRSRRSFTRSVRGRISAWACRTSGPKTRRVHRRELGANGARMRARGIALVGHSERRHVFGETERADGEEVRRGRSKRTDADALCRRAARAARTGDDERRRAPPAARWARRTVAERGRHRWRSRTSRCGRSAPAGPRLRRTRPPCTPRFGAFARQGISRRRERDADPVRR